MNNKIVLAHPLQQHSYKTAEGLDKANFLSKYITTVYYNKDKKIYKILEKIIGSDNVKRMHGRKNRIIEKYICTYNEFLGIIYLFLARFDKLKIIEPKIYSLLTNKFGKKVYKYIKQNNDLLDNDKNKLKNALNELDKLKNENDSNDKKWNKIKVIIKLVLEYGPKYFSLFYPKISEAIATIRLNL